MRKNLSGGILLLLLLAFNGCYSFRGISIDPEVTTFSVRIFDVTAPNAPPSSGIDFAERFKDKIRTQTRLKLVNDNADIEFYGKINEYRVVAVAPQPGEIASENRLEVGVSVGLNNNKNDKKSWTTEKAYRHNAVFSNTQDLLNVQDELLNRQIYPQLLEDIFNAAFNDW